MSLSPPPPPALCPTPCHFVLQISKITLDYSKLHKVSLKSITVETSSKSQNLKIFLRRLSYCCRKAIDDAYNKSNECSNFKYNLVSQFNKLQDNAPESGWKGNFLRTWNSLLNFYTPLSNVLHKYFILNLFLVSEILLRSKYDLKIH